jgi:hypothetical protein
MYTDLQFALTHMRPTKPAADRPSELETRSAFANENGSGFGTA